MKNEKSRASQFPYPVLAVLIFLSIGFITDVWSPTWIIFLTIPLYYVLVEAIEKGTSFIKSISYPIFITIIYLIIGTVFHLWHPGWLIYLTIPIWTFFVGDKDAVESTTDENDVASL